MVQRIEVTGDGITVTMVTEPLRSVFGAVDVVELAWEDILRVSLTAGEFVAADPGLALMTVDTTWGEFLEVTADAEGFTDALRDLCARSAIAVPDLRVPAGAPVEIWRIAGPGSPTAAASGR
ncbi:hypothetical protein [Actinoplanes sp. RD1]|uniref:hypothetical protein n=1 Tax=Actinoplanes sp. RD1 TaxID=3064538 RepID=UPI002740D0FF|nr:hypothetical protein [Actinoplanes sp. RD1]